MISNKKVQVSGRFYRQYSSEYGHACGTILQVRGMLRENSFYSFSIVWSALSLSYSVILPFQTELNPHISFIALSIQSCVSGAVLLLLQETKGMDLPEDLDDLDRDRSQYNRKKKSGGESTVDILIIDWLADSVESWDNGGYIEDYEKQRITTND